MYQNEQYPKHEKLNTDKTASSKSGNMAFSAATGEPFSPCAGREVCSVAAAGGDDIAGAAGSEAGGGDVGVSLPVAPGIGGVGDVIMAE